MTSDKESQALTQRPWNPPHVDAELYLEDSIDFLGGEVTRINADDSLEDFRQEVEKMEFEENRYFDLYKDDESARSQESSRLDYNEREEQKKRRDRFRELYPTLYGKMHYRQLDKEIEKSDEALAAKDADSFYQIFPDWDDYEGRPLSKDANVVEDLEGLSERMWLIRNAKDALASGDGGAIIEALESLIEFGDSQLVDIDSVEHWAGLLAQHLQHRAGVVRKIERDQIAEVINRSCVELCKLIAKDEGVLRLLEWRDLERVIATALDGVGFDVELTPPSKDGGKDVIAECVLYGHTFTYFLEVKHWRSGKRVNASVIFDFIEVNVSEVTDGGLVLSSSGFAEEVYSQLSEICRRGVFLGDGRKIVSLCQHFVRRGRGLWSPTQALPEILCEHALTC